MQGLWVEVTRGDWVESRHAIDAAVVTAEGELLSSWGDASALHFPRSAAKPLQALPTIDRGAGTRFDLTDAEVSVMCASHQGEAMHREAVASILRKIGAVEANLHCGPHGPALAADAQRLARQGGPVTPVYSNCSGKHSGMLALARLLDAPLAGYWEPDHPAQREIRATLLDVTGADTAVQGWGTDGCGVPNYRMSVRQLALGFARIAAAASLDDQTACGAKQLADAMVARPEMVRGSGGFDTELIRLGGGRWICKGGAEGFHAVGLRDGRGVALKTVDGNGRAAAPAMIALLDRLDVLTGADRAALAHYARPSVLNTRGDCVGEIRARIRD
jgi:L-asparaginase II